MLNETKVSKWGNSLSVRVPQAISKQAGLQEGDRLAIALDSEGSIVLRAVRPQYTLEELVSKITPGNRHGETEWGMAQGEEIW